MTEILVRTFPIERLALVESPTDGRIVSGRCVPYGVAATVRDPGTDPYRELFLPGAFRRAAKAPDRVHFKFNHGGNVSDWIGRGLAFSESDEGLDGEFRIVAGAIGDHALALVDDGIMSGLSVGFAPLGRERRDASGTIIRDRCHLVEVSLCPEPAFVGAGVTGRRSKPVDWAPPVDDLFRRQDDEAREAQRDRLRALGIDV